MKMLLSIFIFLLLSLCVNAQNTIQNFTTDAHLTNMVEKGLNELEITNATITIVPLKKYYKKISMASNGKPWGATVGANKRVFTIIFSQRNDAEFKYAREVRLAHELIHIKQGYYDEQPNEKEAYKKQFKLAKVIK